MTVRVKWQTRLSTQLWVLVHNWVDQIKKINGRVGNSLRKPNEIGVHSIRGGSIVGEHEVMYCGLDEVISVKHSAYSKKIFAVGGIKAARFLIGQEVGFYTMDDVLFND